MDIGTTHYLTANLDNLAIHSKYQGPEEVVPGASIDLNNILCVPTAKQNLISDLATWDPMFKGSNEDGFYNLLTSPQQSLIQSYILCNIGNMACSTWTCFSFYSSLFSL
ncbi:hypothetical protein KY290_034198 [Solanum tuberosum]|uniref:Uncharacterized protein n=1 Tax=Solanum tuberosum TaxID=4113 RepID=A0ABQ7U674_SOLTU|nr:hypothetical protein KY289_033582 [Solanum tuberosum]KAH0741155.1 hypothetical protein KY290_034198 [Solanum tuberosum]